MIREISPGLFNQGCIRFLDSFSRGEVRRRKSGKEKKKRKKGKKKVNMTKRSKKAKGENNRGMVGKIEKWEAKKDDFVVDIF